MCHAVSLSESAVPSSWIDGGRLADRIYRRGGEAEVHFCWWHRPALLPVRFDGRLQLVAWGNRGRRVARLPAAGWTWRASVEAGRWASLSPRPVVIPTSFIYSGGVWLMAKTGIQGLLVEPPAAEPVVYMLCQPSTRYYGIATRAAWEPVFVGEVI